jgi:hypothetical protein
VKRQGASEEPNFTGPATLFSTIEKALGQVHSLGGEGGGYFEGDHMPVPE